MAVLSKAFIKLSAAALVTLIAAVPLLFPGSTETQSLETFLRPPHPNDFLEFGAHLSLTAVLASVWWAAVSTRRVARVILIVGIFSVTTEFSQYYVDRGVYVYDLLANFMGMLVTLWILEFWHRQQMNYSRQL